jgi:hypothetical protein
VRKPDFGMTVKMRIFRIGHTLILEYFCIRRIQIPEIFPLLQATESAPISESSVYLAT